MAQVYSGKKYSLFLGRQTDASSALAMGVAQSPNGEFVDLENDSNGFVVYHKDDKELKKVQKLLGDL